MKNAFFKKSVTRVFAGCIAVVLGLGHMPGASAFGQETEEGIPQPLGQELPDGADDFLAPDLGTPLPGNVDAPRFDDVVQFVGRLDEVPVGRSVLHLHRGDQPVEVDEAEAFQVQP